MEDLNCVGKFAFQLIYVGGLQICVRFANYNPGGNCLWSSCFLWRKVQR